MLLLRRISPCKIIKCHLDTLYDDRKPLKNGIRPFGWFEIAVVYIIIPLIIVGLCVFFEFKLSDSFVGALLQIFAIVGGFLINSVILISEKKADRDVKELPKKLLLIDETYYNVSFGIIVCIIATFLCALHYLGICDVFKYALTGLVLSALWIFTHTILMVLKRLTAIFS